MMHKRLTEINGGLAGMALKQESGQTHFYYCMNILYILLNLNASNQSIYDFVLLMYRKGVK